MDLDGDGLSTTGDRRAFQYWVDTGGDEMAALRDAILLRGSEGPVLDVRHILSPSPSRAATTTATREDDPPAARNASAGRVLTLLDTGVVAGQPCVLGIRLHRGSSEPPPSWKYPDFDDSSWESVDETPIGYPAQPFLLGDMQGSYSTFYLRIRLRIANHPEFQDGLFSSLEAELGVDDGFIAYLTGAGGESVEIGRLGLSQLDYGWYGSGAFVPYDAAAVRDHASSPPVSVYTDLYRSSAPAGDYEPEVDPTGETVLAIQVVNRSVGDADCILAPRLSLHQRGPFLVRAEVDTTSHPREHAPTDVEVAVRGAPGLAGVGTRVEFEVGGASYTSDVVEVESESEEGLYVDQSTYRIRLPGAEQGAPNPPLPMDSDVAYRVFLGGEPFHPEALGFRTPGAFDQPFSCLIVGNSGAATPAQAAVAAMLAGESADLLLAAGDFVIRNNRYGDDTIENEYREPALTNQSVDRLFYGPFAANLAASILYQVPGDEDLECAEDVSPARPIGDYDLGVAMPERGSAFDPLPPGEEPGGTTEKYYSFDHGCAHITVVQSAIHNFVLPTSANAARLGDLPTQIEFLRDDLQSTRKFWKIVVLHHPPYTSKERYFGGTPGMTASDDQALRQFLEEALDVDGDGDGGFEELGVDLVISAHNPFFERTHALRTGAGGSHEIVAEGPDFVDPGAPVYVMTGGAGEPLWACLPGDPLCGETALEEFTDEMVREHHALRLSVDANVLTVEALGVGGGVISSSTITKTTFPAFRRGDSNQDGTVSVADPSFSLNQLFHGGPVPHCLDAADADDSGVFNITDPIYTLNWLFQGGPPPPPPGPTACGTDPTADGLACLEYLAECP